MIILRFKNYKGEEEAREIKEQSFYNEAWKYYGGDNSNNYCSVLLNWLPSISSIEITHNKLWYIKVTFTYSRNDFVILEVDHLVLRVLMEMTFESVFINHEKVTGYIDRISYGSLAHLSNDFK